MDAIKGLTTYALAAGQRCILRLTSAYGGGDLRTTDSAMQRLQVGLIGLLVVLVFVSVASMISDGASGPPAVSTNGGLSAGGKNTAGKAQNDEPPVELGVTPIVTEQPKVAKEKSAPAGQTNP
jgi:hypothetical protein